MVYGIANHQVKTATDKMLVEWFSPMQDDGVFAWVHDNPSSKAKENTDEFVTASTPCVSAQSDWKI